MCVSSQIIPLRSNYHTTMLSSPNLPLNRRNHVPSVKRYTIHYLKYIHVKPSRLFCPKGKTGVEAGFHRWCAELCEHSCSGHAKPLFCSRTIKCWWNLVFTTSLLFIYYLIKMNTKIINKNIILGLKHNLDRKSVV